MRGTFPSVLSKHLPQSSGRLRGSVEVISRPIEIDAGARAPCASACASRRVWCAFILGKRTQEVSHKRDKKFGTLIASGGESRASRASSGAIPKEDVKDYGFGEDL